MIASRKLNNMGMRAHRPVWATPASARIRWLTPMAKAGGVRQRGSPLRISKWCSTGGTSPGTSKWFGNADRPRVKCSWWIWKGAGGPCSRSRPRLTWMSISPLFKSKGSKSWCWIWIRGLTRSPMAKAPFMAFLRFKSLGLGKGMN